MATFDPNKKYDSDALKGGDYLLAMVGFERKIGRDSGNPYIRARFKVISGPKKGTTFFSSVGIDVSKDGTAARLSLYCKAVGVTEAFDLDSDKAFGFAFLGKPFKARVKTTVNGQYTNNDIERYILEMNHDENAICEDFWNSWCDENGDSDDGFGGSSSSGGTTPGWGAGGNDSFGGGDFGSSSDDDDIPF